MKRESSQANTPDGVSPPQNDINIIFTVLHSFSCQVVNKSYLKQRNPQMWLQHRNARRLFPMFGSKCHFQQSLFESFQSFNCLAGFMFN